MNKNQLIENLGEIRIFLPLPYQIDSIVFCDSTIVKIRKIDYSQKTMEGVKIVIEKKSYGDVPVFIWAKNTSFSSLLRVTDSSLVLEPLCKHETFRETSISPFWVSVGEVSNY